MSLCKLFLYFGISLELTLFQTAYTIAKQHGIQQGKEDDQLLAKLGIAPETQDFLSLWTNISDACPSFRYIPGSHCEGLRPHVHVVGGQHDKYTCAASAKLIACKAVTLKLKPGDIVIHNSLLVVSPSSETVGRSWAARWNFVDFNFHPTAFLVTDMGNAGLNDEARQKWGK